MKLKQLCRGESVSTFADVNAKWERMVWPIEQLDMVHKHLAIMYNQELFFQLKVDEIYHFLMGLEMEVNEQSEVKILSPLVRNILWPEVPLLNNIIACNLLFFLGSYLAING